MEALAFFPSELEPSGAAHNSVAAQMEAAALMDFPSEASVQPATTAPTAYRVVQATFAVAAGTPADDIEVTIAPAPRGARGTVVSPRHRALREGNHGSSPGFRTVAGTGRAIVMLSIAAALATFIGMTAMTRANPVFTPPTAVMQGQVTRAPVSPDTAAVLPESPPAPIFESTSIVSKVAVTSEVPRPLAQRLVTTTAEPTQHTISTDAVAAQQPLAVIERTSVEKASRNAADSGVSPDRVTFQGALSVETDIAGAAIYVDGRLAGFTPIADWQAPVGSHVVRLELDGYQRWSAVIRIVADETNHLIAKLRPVE
jgi:hypothetical protein